LTNATAQSPNSSIVCDRRQGTELSFSLQRLRVPLREHCRFRAITSYIVLPQAKPLYMYMQMRDEVVLVCVVRGGCRRGRHSDGEGQRTHGLMPRTGSPSASSDATRVRYTMSVEPTPESIC
jgi:hypothetical protein